MCSETTTTDILSFIKIKLLSYWTTSQRNCGSDPHFTSERVWDLNLDCPLFLSTLPSPTAGCEVHCQLWHISPREGSYIKFLNSVKYLVAQKEHGISCCLFLGGQLSKCPQVLQGEVETLWNVPAVGVEMGISILLLGA